MALEYPRREEASSEFINRLLSVAKATRQLMQISLTEIDIVVGQDSFLLAFKGTESLAVIDLAVALSVRASTISKMVDILEKKGWVERQRDGHDLRKVLVRLTPDGLEARGKVLEVWQNLETKLRQAADEEAIDLEAMRRLDDVLAKRLSRLR